MRKAASSAGELDRVEEHEDVDLWEEYGELVDETIDYLKTGFRDGRKPAPADHSTESEPPSPSPQVGDPISACTTLSEVADLVHACTRCRLHRGRRNAVPGEGREKADILFVGEGPGAQEDVQGRPFVGRAGQLLTKMLAAIDLTREEVYITNIVKCRPPENRNPLPDEAETCFPYLQRQIEIIDPMIVVCLGGPAVQRITGSTSGITRMRGTLHRYKDYPVLPTYHPAAVLRFPDKYRRPVWNDLKMLRDYYRELRR
jgi:uracil-DNA glycosylase family 4